MPNYDFTSLSSYDFELLVRDVLQKENNITLESFKSGRDGGIDLRYSRDKRNAIIVQCKHYALTPYGQLIRELKKELEKVKLLNPSRYIIATSMGLTPPNKEEILAIFKSYCKDTGDIYGRDDLNNLLGKFPEVEKSNYKLWLTSSTVLEKILHSDIYNQSQIEIESIKQKLKYYVQNKSFFLAKQILKEINYCIIAGIPGIGKTTLAEILLIDYLAKDYQIYKISNSITEAFRVYEPTRKQIFYYDDFLGQTSLAQKLNKNEDQDILKFIEVVRRSKTTKFVFTTREYILNQAKLTYEKLDNSNFDFKKCVIDLADYTQINRAEILYNHIFFSDMPKEYKDFFVDSKTYNKIIRHKNYNPRIIEWMTNSNFENPKEFVEAFIENLNNPSRLWRHAFENQISKESRNMLITLTSLPNTVMLEDLESSFCSYNKKRKETTNFYASIEEFKKALKELEGNFIVFEKWGNNIMVRFSNPSIRDFLENYLGENYSELRDICLSSIFFEQCIGLWNLQPNGFDSKPIMTLREELLNTMTKNYESRSITIIKQQSSSMIYGMRQDISYEERLLFILNISDQLGLDIRNSSLEILFSRLIELREKIKGEKLKFIHIIKKIVQTDFKYISEEVCIYKSKQYLMWSLESIEDFQAIQLFIDLFPSAFSEDEFNSLRSIFIRFYEEDVNYFLDEDSSDDLESYILQLEDVADFFDFDVSVEIDKLSDRLAELNQFPDEPDYEDDDWWYEKHRDDREERMIEEDIIESLFDSLKEE